MLVVLLLATAVGLSQEHTDYLEALEPLVSALSESALADNTDTTRLDQQVAAFGRGLSKDMPDREQLLRDVRGLLAAAEVTSSVVVVRVDNRYAEIDWVMDLRYRIRRSTERRRETVKVELKDGKVAKIEPLTMFRLSADR